MQFTILKVLNIHVTSRAKINRWQNFAFLSRVLEEETSIIYFVLFSNRL